MFSTPRIGKTMQAQAAQIVQNAMTTKDYWTLGITACFTVLAGILGSIITLWWQNRREKRDAKQHIFMNLMAQRKANPPTFDWVRSANLIDVVFADDADVLIKWHDLYKILSDQTKLGSEDHQHTLIELLSAMARVLGYKNLQQTDIDKFYVPPAYLMQAAANAQAQNEILEIFRTLGKAVQQKMVDEKPPEQLPPPK